MSIVSETGANRRVLTLGGYTARGLHSEYPERVRSMYKVDERYIHCPA